MRTYDKGFTLIELSIVLVVIGLIVGGILVGRDLISAAGIRAQISQIEKYQQVTNAFRGKYGYLPGDIPNPVAASFGFLTRGSGTGEGNGDGILTGRCGSGICPFLGEEAMFWVDLSTAQMIDATFSQATPTSTLTSTISGTGLRRYIPQAKIDNSGSVYVWSGGWSEAWLGSGGDGRNYFALTNVTAGEQYGPGTTDEVPLLTVAQAYAIDKKTDDGLPQSGNVLPMTTWLWAAGGVGYGPPAYSINMGDYDQTSGGPVTSTGDIGDGLTAGSNSCYDGSQGLPEKYSLTQNGGRGLNCWLSFKFQ